MKNPMKVKYDWSDNRFLGQAVRLMAVLVALITLAFGGYYYWDRYIHLGDMSPNELGLTHIQKVMEENPNDPIYLKQVQETDMKRGDAVFAGLLEFGIELIDGLPEDTRWLKQLKRLEKMKQLDISGFDLKDEFDLEFLYKRYVAVAGDDLRILAPLHGLNPMGVARARSTFLGDQARDADRGLPTEGNDTDGDTDE